MAMKSTVWLIDPRPNLPSMVSLVEKSFQLSEASNTPVMMELRIRACHLQGRFEARDNVAPDVSMKQVLAEPAPHDYERLAHPPVTFGHGGKKSGERMDAARAFIAEHKLNELFDGTHKDVGLIVQGGYTTR